MWLLEALKYAALALIWGMILTTAIVVVFICLSELACHYRDWYNAKIEEYRNDPDRHR